jgi:hypothetical protein
MSDNLDIGENDLIKRAFSATEDLIALPLDLVRAVGEFIFKKKLDIRETTRKVYYLMAIIVLIKIGNLFVENSLLKPLFIALTFIFAILFIIDNVPIFKKALNIISDKKKVRLIINDIKKGRLTHQEVIDTIASTNLENDSVVLLVKAIKSKYENALPYDIADQILNSQEPSVELADFFIDEFVQNQGSFRPLFNVFIEKYSKKLNRRQLKKLSILPLSQNQVKKLVFFHPDTYSLPIENTTNIHLKKINQTGINESRYRFLIADPASGIFAFLVAFISTAILTYILYIVVLKRYPDPIPFTISVIFFLLAFIFSFTGRTSKDFMCWLYFLKVKQ